MDKHGRSNRLIKLQFLIRQSWRNPEGLRRIQGLLSRLKLEITTTGLVSFTAQMRWRDFAKLFGAPAARVAPNPPSQFDFGRSGGSTKSQLTIPHQLQEYIESISVAPPHIRLK